MDDLNKDTSVKTENKFFEDAEKVVNRLLKQYDSLLELSKKHKVNDEDVNYMFNEIKKYHENVKKEFKSSDKDDGFSFKRK
jgi:DNA-binding ferritin-like protein